MARLKKVKIEDELGLFEYYENNRDDIYEQTIKILKSFWKKNGVKDDIDIFEIEVKSNPNMKYISVLITEWEQCFDEIEEYYVYKENYVKASEIRDFRSEVFKNKL
jgi:hypothetical protein